MQYIKACASFQFTRINQIFAYLLDRITVASHVRKKEKKVNRINIYVYEKKKHAEILHAVINVDK